MTEKEHLMKLTVKQLRKICQEECICPGYDAARKESLVDCIITNRRHRKLYDGA